MIQLYNLQNVAQLNSVVQMVKLGKLIQLVK